MRTDGDDPLSGAVDGDHQQLMYLLDNTFITLSNFSTGIELPQCHSVTRYRLINTIVHWILCSLSSAADAFISMVTEDALPIHISPRQISLQIIAKWCTNALNVDCILLDLSREQLLALGHALLDIMHTSGEPVDREHCLMIICSLCKRNRALVQFFCSHRVCLELIFNYLECYEYQQQQYVIATLTTCCYASSSSMPLPVPTNHSMDMMIDSCVQLLLLFTAVKENNYLRLFEHKLVDISSSIYFEQKILRGFAEILFLMKL